MGGFGIDEQRHDGYVVVRLDGVLDEGSVDAFDARIRPLTGRYDPEQIVLDLTALERIDDAGSEALARIARICAPYGQIELREPPIDLRDDVLALFDVRERDQPAAG